MKATTMIFWILIVQMIWTCSKKYIYGKSNISCGRTLSMWSSVTTFLFWSEACLAALTELSTTKTFVSSVISSTASSEIFVLVLMK
jgi:hypothetical protein